MDAPLPTARAILDSLFSHLPRQLPTGSGGGDQTPSKSLRGLSTRDKQSFVTLHCLFPNELLPALDLLDRQLVTRLIQVDRPEQQEQEQHEQPEAPRQREPTSEDVPPARSDNVYYVRSTQTAPRNRHHQLAAGDRYEVRLSAWNCTCPAFVLAAFRAPAPAADYDTADITLTGEDRRPELGGLSLGDKAPPLCKHLMACFLAEKCDGLLRGYVLESRVSREELAGWAAGWGD